MREIKFRIWCKQTEEMHTVERMGFDDGELWYVEDEDRHTQPPYFMDRNDSVLMQYTGLKDKNGREIYEGDILRLKAKKGYEYLGDVGVIRMSYSAYVIGTSTGEYLFIYFDEVEIIGNIYENPELLEVNK